MKNGVAAENGDADVQLQLGDDAPQIDTSGAEKSPETAAGPTQWAALALLHGVLVLVQIIFAGQQVLAGVALSGGLSQLVYTVYRNIVALSILGPCAYAFEKKKRPPLTPRLMLKFFMLGLTGIMGGQQLFLAGLVYSSTVFAATMQNCVPVITFLLACALGLEKVRLFRPDGAAKVLGTAVCVVGALFMSLYRGGAVFQGDEDVPVPADVPWGPTLTSFAGDFEIQRWQIGGALVLISCVGSATYLIIQVPILKECAAPLTITAFTYAFGTIQILLVMLLFTNWRSGWALSTGIEVVSVVYAGVMTSAVNFSLQTWAIQQGGSLMASLYYPMQSVYVAFITVCFLGQNLRTGTLVGGVGEVGGVYLVIWGQVRHRKQIAHEAAEEGAGPHRPVVLPGSELAKPLLPQEEAA